MTIHSHLFGVQNTEYAFISPPKFLTIYLIFCVKDAGRKWTTLIFCFHCIGAYADQIQLHETS